MSLLIAWSAAVVWALVPIQERAAAEQLSMILTSNLQGRFSLESEDQDTQDVLLVLAQSILKERKRGAVDLYLDLGNSFYPGPLSKYSSGSVVMDYFTTLSCDATLVSSKDMQIGADTLEGLMRRTKPALLSATILKDERPLFDPYIVYSKGRRSVAVVGISSTKIRFDIAEKHLYNVDVLTETKRIEPVLKEIKERGIDHILVLSGLSVEDTIDLLSSYPEIDMAICGGDNTGALYGSEVERIDMSDGRPILLLSSSDGYYSLTVLVDKGMTIKSFTKKKVETAPSTLADVQAMGYDRRYRDFSQRLSIWKERFKEEEDRVLASTQGEEYTIDDAALANMLRDRFDTEVSLVGRNTLKRATYEDEIRRSDISHIVLEDYDIFVFTLEGDEVKKILAKDVVLTVSGADGERIQGYPIEGTRKYKIASTQSAFETVERILGKELRYKNTWINVTDLLVEDLAGKRILFKTDYGYLERRLRTTVDVHLANFFDYADVDTDKDIDPPPGWPLDTYKRWGLENKIDVSFYNRHHRLVLTPYVIYQRQDDTYQQNQLRGTILYELNIHPIVKPYHKSQIETVLEEEKADFRPIRIRETVGAFVTKDRFSGRLGMGLEKLVNDPVEDPNYGGEAIAHFEYPFWDYCTYIFDLDSFISVDSARSEVENVLSVSLRRYLALSLKHKLYYFNNWDDSGDYLNSQVIAALDLKTQFKWW